METTQDIFKVHGYYTVSNAGGFEIELSSDGSAARVRDAYGSDSPKISDWFEIEYLEYLEGDQDENGQFETRAVIDSNGYNIPLDQVIRVKS